MIGTNAQSATPIILFISDPPGTGRDAREELKKSSILPKYPEFRTAHSARDPDLVDLVGKLRAPGNGHRIPAASINQPLTGDVETNMRSGSASGTGPSLTTVVYYDATVPLTKIGQLIYVRHASGYRAATANVIRLKDNLVLQTVYHVFCDSEDLPSSETRDINDGDEQDIDDDFDIDPLDVSDSDTSVAISGFEDGDELDVGDHASASSIAPPAYPTSVDAESQYLVGGAECRPMTSSVEPVSEPTIFESRDASTSPQHSAELVMDPSKLAVVGRLCNYSVDQDWALVSIDAFTTTEGLSDQVKSAEITSHVLAFDHVAPLLDASPLVTRTGSNGKLEGELSGTSSYIRLPNSVTFQEVYPIRLDGMLSYGASGSVVMDKDEKITYGHLITGTTNQAPSVAYFIASHQTIASIRTVVLPSDITEGSEVLEDVVDLSSFPPGRSTVNQGISFQEPEDYSPPELDENNWEFQSDNDFALRLFTSLGIETRPLHETKTTTLLCGQCTRIQNELWTPGFAITISTANMVQNANNNLCALCELLWQAFPDPKASDFGLERVGSNIHVVGNRQPIFSIVELLPDPKSPAASHGQVGFVELPKAGKETHLAVIRYWLRDCDANHDCFWGPYSQFGNISVQRLPSRLIEVGHDGDESVRLVETYGRLRREWLQDSGQWVALSHVWGEAEGHSSTVPTNLQQHLDGIRTVDLPQTFMDAVTVTRALRCRYLWIDSLCIIPGPEGDFTEEAERMEDAFSGAYCVIVASSASSHNSGFLKTKDPRPRDKRNYVELSSNEKGTRPTFICQAIDNFKLHVLDGALNHHGWAYAQHALARRTIFFTEFQTYFECGAGVRCETSTRLKNKRASYIGDPDFPDVLMKATRADRNSGYQMVFKQYSTLSLSSSVDRPLAINGLLKRLHRGMKVKGGVGIFDDEESPGVLRRSLLWVRNSAQPSLTRINFPKTRTPTNVPSWSWMAYTGAIDYLQPEFGSYAWEDLESPWSAKSRDALGTVDHTPELFLKAKAYNCNVSTAQGDDRELVFDDPARAPHDDSTCIILGKAKGAQSRKTQRHFVLIITPMFTIVEGHTQSFERIGAGYLPGNCISPDSFEVSIY
ncbi:hypothetical protein NX059_009878 [Plenodomus lindquistii]|nr:hypothetical protein NX059_009878 [Plenodomus lindquistii]